MQHKTHPEIVKRLQRAGGHLRKIIGMIEEGRPCLELAQQIQAIENAIDNAKKSPDSRPHQSLHRPVPQKPGSKKEKSPEGAQSHHQIPVMR